VTVTNADPTAHTWTADDGGWDSGSLAQGASSTHTFTTAGTFAYHCAIHASMKGTVVVDG
jgi:plastocyanin